MLNDIRLHLDSDENMQSRTEEILAKQIDTLQAKNVVAFKQHVPSIGAILAQLPFERLSVIVDKQQQFNIVDFQSGTTLYGPHVDTNIEAQVNAWAYNSALLDFANTQPSPILAANKDQQHDFACRRAYAQGLQSACEKSPIDTLVVLGLGKGQQIAHLLAARLLQAQSSDAQLSQASLLQKQITKVGCSTSSPAHACISDEPQDATTGSFPTFLPTTGLKNVVIYEPDWEIFRCSLSIFNWADLLAQAQICGLQLFFQIGTDIHLLYDEITELQQVLKAQRILFYKHINSPVYMQIINGIAQGQWGRAISQLPSQSHSHHYHFLHSFSAANAQQHEEVNVKDALFCSNMALFEEYFPNIHASFINYQPQCWQTIKDKNSAAINLLNSKYGTFYANTSPQQEGEALAQHFTQHPNVDGLVFGYEGDKLRHYLHNTFIRHADMILRENEESQGELPENVKVLMMFGLGNAYMLDALYQQDSKHAIQNLIICEPNPDFFYASLYAIDWAPIFAQVDEGKHQLYINIGESSSLLFRDIMSQFLALGPHLLNETFIAQAYHNPMLQKVMFEVRQQLKVIFAMGENFDHVAYGIAHTVKAMQNQVPVLRYQPSQYLAHENKQTPIFLVGNGPSLDDSIDIIKEYKGEAIIVSCGTALQALYKNGITPDFHGEVEQNRANFDWASRINDREYLKKITLLSVNGIHPDTISLYKNVLIAFKSGESSSHTMLAMLPKDSYHNLEYSYPTVTNMAMSYFLSMGFEQLYLVGVDLGFADQSKHHSSASGYYENGQQIYDYKSVHAADLRVKGNRQEWVFTKTEFNISRMIVEQLLQSKHAATAQAGQRNIECFNLSNGVFIEGTLPLHPDSVLVIASKAQKLNTMQALQNCFIPMPSNVLSMLSDGYKSELMASQLALLSTISAAKIHSKDDIYAVIESLSSLLKDAKREGKSLFFYYFFNTVNYVSAALSKASLQSDEQLAILAATRLLLYWQVMLADAKNMLDKPFSLIDTANAFGDKREKLLLQKCAPVRFISSNHSTIEAMRAYLHEARYEGIDVEYIDKIVIEKSANFLREALADNAGDSPVIINIENIEEVLHYLPLFNHPNNKAWLSSHLGLLFHDYELLVAFIKQYPIIAKAICLLYCSPLHLPDVLPSNLPLDLPRVATNKAANNNQNIKEGLQDFLLIDEFCHFIHAKGQDLSLYSHIIAKPKFSERGLQNAYHYQQMHALVHSAEDLQTSSMADLQTIKLTDSENKKSAMSISIAQSDAQKPNAGKPVYAPNNEYDSVAVAIINKNIIRKLPPEIASKGYMFKYYFACLKNTQSTAADLAEAPLTIVDTLENRGYLLNRLPFDFELKGDWQSADIPISANVTNI